MWSSPGSCWIIKNRWCAQVPPAAGQPAMHDVRKVQAATGQQTMDCTRVLGNSGQPKLDFAQVSTAAGQPRMIRSSPNHCWENEGSPGKSRPLLGLQELSGRFPGATEKLRMIYASPSLCCEIQGTSFIWQLSLLLPHYRTNMFLHDLFFPRTLYKTFHLEPTLSLSVHIGARLDSAIMYWVLYTVKFQ